MGNNPSEQANLTLIEENSMSLNINKFWSHSWKLCIGCVNRKYTTNASFEIISVWSKVKSLKTE